MTSREIAHTVSGLYKRFLREQGVTPQTVYANILWKWHDYLNANKTW